MSGRVLINAQITRNLGDRSDDKRKQAALDIEAYLKELDPSSPAAADRVKLVISQLVSDFLLSWQPNFRKGGLIGLSAVAISLLDDAAVHLHKLLPPILRCTLDTDARVRYYACEALYNVAKVARGHLLIYFNELFDALCKLYADPDADVRSAAQLLDRLTKDIVTECAAFDVEYFIPLLRERTRLRSPYVRQLILGWVLLLDSLPDIDLLEYLPEVLPGIFDMLSDPNKDIRQYSYSTLTQLLRQIAHAPRIDLGTMVPLLAAQAAHRDPFRRLTVLVWLGEFAHVGKGSILPHLPSLLTVAMGGMGDLAREIRAKAQALNNTLLRLTVETSADVDLAAVVPTVLSQLGSSWVPARLASLRWIAVLTALHPESVFAHLHAIFPVLLTALQDPDEQVVRLTLEAIARLALDSEGRVHAESSRAVFRNLLRLFASDVDLLEARGGLIIRQLSLLLGAEEVFFRITDNLKNNSEIEFTALIAQTLSLLLLTAAETQPLRSKLRDEAFPRAFLGSFATFGIGEEFVPIEPMRPFRLTKWGKRLLEAGYIRAGHDTAATTTTTAAAAAAAAKRPRMAAGGGSNMVQGAGSSRVAELLTKADAAAAAAATATATAAAASTAEAGSSAATSATAAQSSSTSPLPSHATELSSPPNSAAGLFTFFFNTWCHSPVAALSLCLLARNYELASFIVTELSGSEMTVGSLLQLDRLVQLLESPVLAHVRFDLIAPRGALVLTLHGVLSLLPQSAAYTALATRLKNTLSPSNNSASGANNLFYEHLIPPSNKEEEAAPPERRKWRAQVREWAEAYWGAADAHAGRRRRVAVFASLLADEGADDDDDDGDVDDGDDGDDYGGVGVDALGGDGYDEGDDDDDDDAGDDDVGFNRAGEQEQADDGDAAAATAAVADVKDEPAE